MRMARYKFIMCLLLLHRLVISSNVSEIMLSSQDHLPVEESVFNTDIRRNFTDLTVLVNEESRFLSRNISTLNGTRNDGDPLDLDQTLRIWNPVDVSRIWKNEMYRDVRVSKSCGEDISRYMLGVLKKTNWALRMMDADGKRTWGTFSGSKYWVGDVNQCRKMENEFIAWQKDKKMHRNEELPPFRVSVNSVSFALDILKPGLNGTRNVTLGLCLPNTCHKKDIQNLLYFFVKNQSNVDFPFKITIDSVRNLSKGYVIWEDTIFYVLLGSFVIACILTLIGTFYDIALRYEILRENNSNDNDTDLELVRLNRFDHKVTLSKLWAVSNHNDSLDVHNSKEVPKPLSEALLSFSLFVNLSKLCSLDIGVDTLAPIHGLRFFSMLWVILGHTCVFADEISDNKVFRLSAESDFLYQTVANGTHSVDTFLFISGCLVTFLYFRTMATKTMQERKITKGYWGQFFQFLAMVLYRYFRLTPVYLLVIGLTQVSMKWYHDHSVVELATLDYVNCEKYWWRNALYINTYFDKKERCMTWSWYLANDTQYFILGVIILLIGASFLPLATFLVGFFLLASWITTAIITVNVGHVPSIQDPYAHYESLYDKPWTRIGPYLVGMAAGWYLSRINCKANMSKVVVAVGWSISLSTMASIIYGLYGAPLGPIMSALYTALSHSAWAMCIAWIVIACVTGHGGPINHILSWKYLYPISRLTYCTYLVHSAIIRAIILRGESSWHLTHGFVTIVYFGVVVTSYGVSLFLSLLYEAPVISMLRIIHPLRQWKVQYFFSFLGKKENKK